MYLRKSNDPFPMVLASVLRHQVVEKITLRSDVYRCAVESVRWWRVVIRFHVCHHFGPRTMSLVFFVVLASYHMCLWHRPAPIFVFEQHFMVSSSKSYPTTRALLAAGARAPSSCHHSHLLAGIAEEDHIDSCHTGQLAAHGYSARRTCGWHSPWLGGEHALYPKHSYLGSTLATSTKFGCRQYAPFVSASLSTSPPTNPTRSSLAKA